MAGLYIHIPYCRQACHYCDFHFSTNLASKAAMLKGMASELRHWQATWQGGSFETIYFGGGTPSILEDEEIAFLMRVLDETFDLSKATEITLEANPDDFLPGKAKFWKQLGINRLSIGIQTFDSNRLKWMNRAHSARQAQEAVEQARVAGFGNLNLDLMYNFPQAEEADLKLDIELLTNLMPEHISAYSLTIEPKTTFGVYARKGLLTEVDEDKASDQFVLVRNMLSDKGFEPYEVSNFAKPGFASKHNSQYWFQTPYLGIGPGAYSFDGTFRWANEGHNARYIKNWCQPGITEPQKERMSQTDLANEMILTRLRTIWGLSLKELEEKTGIDLAESKRMELEALMAQKLIQMTSATLFLTDRGLLLSDFIALKLCL